MSTSIVGDEIVLPSVGWVHLRGLVGSFVCVSVVPESWPQLVLLLTLVGAGRLAWAAGARRRGHRRVGAARRSIMRLGVLVDAAGLGRGVNAGMAYRVHAEPRGRGEPVFVCRVQVGPLPLAFAMRPRRGRDDGLPARQHFSPRFDERYLVEAAPTEAPWRRILPLAQRQRAEGLCDLEAEIVGEALIVRQPRVRDHEVKRVVRFATELGAALLEAGESSEVVVSRPVDAAYRSGPRVERAETVEPPVVGALRREFARRRKRRPRLAERRRLGWALAFYGAVVVWFMMQA